MATRMVFSCEKYEEQRLKDGCDLRYIKDNTSTWGAQCEGLTRKEMDARGYMTKDEWMKEVPHEVQE